MLDRKPMPAGEAHGQGAVHYVYPLATFLLIAAAAVLSAVVGV